MKFQNLLGMFAVLLIALSGPSYASGHGSPPPSPPPSPPTTFIPPPIITFVPSVADMIAPMFLEPEGTEICDGSLEVCKNKGKSEGDNDYIIQGTEIGKNKVTELVSSIVQRVIRELGDGAIITNKKRIFDAKKQELGNDWFDTLVFFIENRGPVDNKKGRPALFIEKAAKQSEYRLRKLKITLLEEINQSDQKNECPISCQESNKATLQEVISSHEKLKDALERAGIKLF